MGDLHSQPAFVISAGCILRVVVAGGCEPGTDGCHAVARPHVFLLRFNPQFPVAEFCTVTHEHVQGSPWGLWPVSQPETVCYQQSGFIQGTDSFELR